MTTSQESTPTARAVSPDSGTHWTEEGAWQVAPGIHRIPLPLPMDGLRAVNIYAIEDGPGLTLIDGGWAIDEARPVLERGLRQLGHTLGDIRRFLVTHVHRDHYTHAVVLGREFGADVSLGRAEDGSLHQLQNAVPGESHHTPLLLRAGADDLAREWAREHLEVRFNPDHWAEPDTWLEGDHEIRVGDHTLTAVATPGHTRGHYVFAELGAGLLFSGDHVLPTITPSIGFEGVQAPNPLGDFMASQARVRELPDLRLAPAHGPVGMSSHERATQLLAHHEHRLQLCLDSFGEAGQTAYEVAGQLPWTRHDRAFATLDTFNAALATMETHAHLRLLVTRGLLTAVEVDGHDVYRLAGAVAGG